MRLQGEDGNNWGSANPAGGLDIAKGALTYDEKKKLNDGITGRLANEELTDCLFGSICCIPDWEKRFHCIRWACDLLPSGGGDNG